MTTISLLTLGILASILMQPSYNPKGQPTTREPEQSGHCTQPDHTAMLHHIISGQQSLSQATDSKLRQNAQRQQNMSQAIDFKLMQITQSLQSVAQAIESISRNPAADPQGKC